MPRQPAQRMTTSPSSRELHGFVGQGMDGRKRMRIRLLRAASGGGGGGADAGGGLGTGAGAGAGGFDEDDFDLAPGIYRITGGPPGVGGGTTLSGTKGGDLTITLIGTLLGGGFGGGPFLAGGDGGSGGGGGDTDAADTAPGKGTPGQGNDGLQGSFGTGSPVGGHGGGARGPATLSFGPGPGAESDITGVPVTYSRGGANTGPAPTGYGHGGSGGLNTTPATDGAPWIVVWSYPGSPVCLGGTIVTVNGVTTHTFTANGDFIIPRLGAGL